MWSKVYDTSIASCWEKPIFVLFILLINVVLPWLESTPFVPNYRLFDFFNPKFDHSSYSKICAKHHFFCWGSLYQQHIRCKPISPCKLCKLQSRHRINIQGRGTGEVEGGICKSPPALGLGNHTFTNPPLPPPLRPPLDVDPVVQIEVYIVCTKRLVCTWYVPCFISTSSLRMT